MVPAYLPKTLKSFSKVGKTPRQNAFTDYRIAGDEDIEDVNGCYGVLESESVSKLYRIGRQIHSSLGVSRRKKAYSTNRHTTNLSFYLQYKSFSLLDKQTNKQTKSMNFNDLLEN